MREFYLEQSINKSIDSIIVDREWMCEYLGWTYLFVKLKVQEVSVNSSLRGVIL